MATSTVAIMVRRITADIHATWDDTKTRLVIRGSAYELPGNHVDSFDEIGRLAGENAEYEIRCKYVRIRMIQTIGRV